MGGLKMYFSGVYEIASRVDTNDDSLLTLFQNAHKADPAQIPEYRRRAEKEHQRCEEILRSAKEGQSIEFQKGEQKRIDVLDNIIHALDTFEEQKPDGLER